MTSRAYYNENDPKAAAWLRELIKAGLIADGDVDERSITEVQPDDLTPYGQCHFFAGIGGWSYALRLASVPDSFPVWTGSCPCQPFSAAGKQLGEADERHLWPDFRNLIAKRNPAIVFGEQVASKLGRGWLSRVRVEMEELGYAFGAADLCAAGISAPHIRQRLYWVANASDSKRRALSVGRLGDSNGSGLCERAQRHCESEQPGFETSRGTNADRSNPWAAFERLHCLDGKARRIEPGSFPLADGVPGRVGLLRGYGNAIVPQVAAQFIQASFEAIESLTP